MKTILGIGEAVLDESCLLDSFPEEGSKVQPKKVEYSIGGPVTAALTLLSRFGMNCTLIASIGDDTHGEKVKKTLSRENINLITRRQKLTKVNTYLVNAKNGSRTGIKTTVKHSPIKRLSKRLIQKADLIIFDRHEPIAFEEVMSKKRKDTKVIVDPSTEVSAKTLKMLELADYPIIPYESLTKIRRHENYRVNLDYLYKITRKHIIVTVGEQGALIYNGKDIELVPAVNIKSIDSLGAGDIFRAAFGYGILNNWTIRRCTEYANLVAGLQCTKVGNDTAIPTPEEIVKFEKKAIMKKFSIRDLEAIFI